VRREQVASSCPPFVVRPPAPNILSIPEFAELHIGSIANETHALQFQERSLLKPRFTRQQYFAAAAKDPLPWKAL
jgi:hypothetical protein